MIKNFRFSKLVDKSEIAQFNQYNDWWKPNEPLLQYNYLRTTFMREQIDPGNYIQFLNDKKILDVGCGGGLLAESLTRLGGVVKGIDPCANSINIAKEHQKLDQSLINLTYEQTSSDQIVDQQFDIVTSLEVIEHIQDKKWFIETLSPLVKDNGFLFLSTIEKTIESYLKVIFIAEKVLGLIDNGTHQYEKFINHQNLINLVEKNSFQLKNKQFYDINLLGNMVRTNYGPNYILCFQKIKQK